MTKFSKRRFFEQIDYDPHKGQVQVHAAMERAPLVVVSAGSRLGKTMCAGSEMAFESVLPRPKNRPVHDFMGWCVAPYHDQADKVWEETYDYLCKFLGGAKHIQRNKSEGRMEFRNLAGGRSRVFRRATDQAAGKKRHVAYAVDFMVIDEASNVDSEVWEKQLSTRLADRSGRVLMISTPQGRRGFFASTFRQAARDPEIIALKIPTWINPYVDMDYVRRQKRILPAMAFAQEYGAEFVAAEGQVFPEELLENLCVLDFEPPSDYMSDYVASCDLAMSYDHTVLMVARAPRPTDEDSRPRVVHVDRFHKMPIEQQIERISATLDAYGRAPCKVDETGLGQPIVQQMRNFGMPVEGVSFAGANKRNKIMNACAIVEREAILLPHRDACPVFFDEMSNYEWRETPTGHLTAAAPEGAHDDTVAAWLLMCDWFPAAGTQGKARYHKAGYYEPKITDAEPPEDRPRRQMAARGLADPNYRGKRGSKRAHTGGQRRPLWGNSLFG